MEERAKSIQIPSTRVFDGSRMRVIIHALDANLVFRHSESKGVDTRSIGYARQNRTDLVENIVAGDPDNR